MATMEGRITLAQESRFQLTDGAGVGHLFTLGPWCAAEPQQLAPLARSGAPVRVKYKAGTGVIGHVAQRIDLRDGPRDAAPEGAGEGAGGAAR